jgi:outer membrane protein assembly factor BamB
VAAILAAVAIAVSTRTTAPDDYGEESAPATGPVPVVAPGDPSAPVTLSSYPLIVGDRLRVTGHESGVTAHPVSAPGDGQAHWRYDRPDDELVRLALAGAPREGGQVIVSLWDDGLLAGVDALTGEPRWRVVVDETMLAARQFDPADVVAGRSLKVVDAVGGDVVVVQVDDVLVGLDAADGDELWRRDEGLCPEAPAPLSGSSWWTMGGHVVVVATCPSPDGLDATVRLIDPRTGEVADEVASRPPWQPVGSGDGAAVVAVGCRPDLTGCSLTEHTGVGNLSREPPVRWAVQDGRLAEVTRTEATGIEPRPNGGFELFAVDRATGELAWTVTGQAYDLGRLQFHDADATGEAVCVGGWPAGARPPLAGRRLGHGVPGAADGRPAHAGPCRRRPHRRQRLPLGSRHRLRPRSPRRHGADAGARPRPHVLRRRRRVTAGRPAGRRRRLSGEWRAPRPGRRAAAR